MLSLLHPDLQRRIRFKIYRAHFLLLYILIGFASIVLELIIFKALSRAMPDLAAKVIGVAGSVAFAFVLNARYNFRVPRPKLVKAFAWFVSISFLSLFLNIAFQKRLAEMGFSYAVSRIIASGCLFYLAYLLHRRFTFREFKKVGVAVYAHGVEDIRKIWEKIQFYSDFIHVDLVDKSYNESAPDPATYRIEAIRAYWPDREIHCHIMSRTPSEWLDKVIPHVDTVLIHVEAQDDVRALLSRIRAEGKKAGLVLMAATPVEACRPYLSQLDEIMLLTIPNPGKSGQKFDMGSLERIEAINDWAERGRFTLCVDGGVNSQNVHLLQVEKVVSGSFVLDHDQPIRRIMSLQTSNQFEKT
jgi:ribulose-phosphate 3-epimerase